MIRKIIKIDEEKCNGCALCIPECKEGAIQIIDGKARLISDLFCDGLGACLGHCPEGAIIIEEREAEPYDEIKVLQKIYLMPAVLRAHMQHLTDHNDTVHYNEAVEFLESMNVKNPLEKITLGIYGQKHGALSSAASSSCPGSSVIMLDGNSGDDDESSERESELRQWPIQLHLVSPSAPYFRNSKLVIMSTCGPVASANVHNNYIKGNSIVLACPKLDYTEPYRNKLAAIFEQAGTKEALVVIMEVPCCKGLTKMAVDAAMLSGRNDLTITEDTLTLDGRLKRSTITYGN